MKYGFMCLVAIFATPLFAQAQQSTTHATVLNVHEYENYPSTAGSNPSDAPLTAEVHTYEISVRVNCTTFTGRYDTGLDYFPSTLAVNSSVPVRVGKHNLYFSVPGYGPLRVPITKRKQDRSSPCATLNRVQITSS
ncbi:MAG TPA: hypothetical protein VMT53_23700 [Terriglobales bacterium]|nr:hypothetical protein [Terriglobales bacterium]